MMRGTPGSRHSACNGLAVFGLSVLITLSAAAPTSAGSNASTTNSWSTVTISNQATASPAAPARAKNGQQNDSTAAPPKPTITSGMAPQKTPNPDPPPTRSTAAEIKPDGQSSPAASTNTSPAADSRQPNAAYVGAVKTFCSNIIPAAIDARYAWQRRTIAELEKDIAERTEKLDAKIAETKSWLVKREEFSAKANNALVQVFARMKPDAAARQISELEDLMAAALIMKLDPKIAAPIVAEIDPVKAAQIARLLSAAAAKPESPDASVPPSSKPAPDAEPKP